MCLHPDSHCDCRLFGDWLRITANQHPSGVRLGAVRMSWERGRELRYGISGGSGGDGGGDGGSSGGGGGDGGKR